MSALYDFVSVVVTGLDRLNTTDFYTTIGLAIVFSSLCFIGCFYFGRLWNKTFHTSPTYLLLGGLASVLTFFFVLAFVALTFLREVSLFKITHWANITLADKAWIVNTTKSAYYKVKKAGVEDFTGFPEPTATVSIPVSKPETRTLCAEHFAESATDNFDDQHPFLAKLVWAKSGIPSDSVVKDIQSFFGNVSEQTTNPIQTAITTDDEFDKRLRREGAQTGAIQLTLLWNNHNDLDLHCIDPNNEEINYSHRSSASGGELDVDMNAGRDQSSTPVENIYWMVETALAGHYKVLVNNYANHGALDPTPFRVRVKTNGQVQEFTDSLSNGEAKKLIYEFDYVGAPSGRGGRAYQAKDAVLLVSRVIRGDLEKQIPRVVITARVLLVLLFLLVQAIPFGIIGWAASRELRPQT